MNNVVIRRYLERSRLAETLVEDVLVEHRSAMFAQDVEELVLECLELEKMSKRAWDYVLDILFSDRANETDDLGNMMKMAVAKISVVFDRVNQLIEESKRSGHTPKDAADFLIARQDIQKIGQDVEKKFPPIDYKKIELAREAFHRGECIDVEEMLREAQSGSPP
jgi:hypothetical protein